jgi:hypothetical protein
VGMVMYARAVAETQLAEFAGNDEAFIELLTGPGSWEAEKMWWAAWALLLGPDGMTRVEAEPLTTDAGYTPVMRVPRDALSAIAAEVRSVDRTEIERRFDGQDFGVPIGPEVMTEDRDWLCGAADGLRTTLLAGAVEDQAFIFVVV